jgi:hypothetical protein
MEVAMRTRIGSALFLRIASVLTLLFAAGHIFGGLDSWSPVGETDVLGAMRSFHFDAEGVDRTYLDFYLGFGFVLGTLLVLLAVLLWQLASTANTDPPRARPMTASILAAFIISAVLSWVLILPVAAVSFAVIAACLGLALLTPRHDGKPPTVTTPRDSRVDAG